MMHCKRLIRFAAAAVAAALVSTAAFAQSYPVRPVKVVVPYPPGGPTDIVARVLAQKLSEQTGQQFLVDNRAGAGGNIGAEAVARSAPDGYTLLVATTAHAINRSIFKQLGYDVVKDFAPITQLTAGPLVIVANPALKANSVSELIALAKAKPGELAFASSGPGQSTHLSAELFSAMAGIKMTHVPYKGSAPALTDVMGGQRWSPGSTPSSGRRSNCPRSASASPSRGSPRHGARPRRSRSSSRPRWTSGRRS